jgi:hypothetical protein
MIDNFFRNVHSVTMQNVLNVAASHYVEGKLKATLQLFKKIQNTKAIFNPDLFSAIIFCR